MRFMVLTFLAMFAALAGVSLDRGDALAFAASFAAMALCFAMMMVGTEVRRSV